jgi:hypothetical protein
LFDHTRAAGVGVVGIRVLAGGALSGSAERHPIASPAPEPIGSAISYDADADRARRLVPLVNEGFRHSNSSKTHSPRSKKVHYRGLHSTGCQHFGRNSPANHDDCPSCLHAVAAKIGDPALNGFYREVRRTWLRCLRRRSQKSRRMGWPEFETLTARFRLPTPHITRTWAQARK